MPPDNTQQAPVGAAPQDDGIHLATMDDAAAHVNAMKGKMSKIEEKKTLGYRQLDLMRKDNLTKFVLAMKQRGVDVSTPEKLQDFLVQLSQVDPDAAQYMSWMIAQMMPDPHETQHMSGMGVANVAMSMMNPPPAAPQQVPPAMPTDQQPQDVPMAPQ